MTKKDLMGMDTGELFKLLWAVLDNLVTRKVSINVPVAVAAKLMNVSQQYIRVGIQQGVLTFGSAVRISGTKYSYYISPSRLKQFLEGAAPTSEPDSPYYVEDGE